MARQISPRLSPYMVNLLPFKRVTLVSAYSPEEVWQKLEAVTYDIRHRRNHWEDPFLLFNGVIGPQAFSISRKIPTANNFLPMIEGQIEPTSTGCIIFLTYRLFFSTRLILISWSLLTLIFALFFLFYKIQIGYALLALLLMAMNYLITVLNFNRQIQFSERLLNRVLA